MNGDDVSDERGDGAHDGWIVVYEDGYVLGDAFGHVRLFDDAAAARDAAKEAKLSNGSFMERPVMYEERR